MHSECNRIATVSAQEGRTAVIIAANCGHHDIVHLLLERGADMDVRSQVRFGTAFEVWRWKDKWMDVWMDACMN